MGKIESKLLLVFLTLIWVGGGLSFHGSDMVVVGTIASGLWLGWASFKTKKIIFPKYFLWACGLVMVAGASIWWSGAEMETLKLVLLIASGILWWVGARTWSQVKGLDRVVKTSILLAGCIFTTLWMVKTVFGWPQGWDYGVSSLVTEASAYKNHNHLGDWWMVMLVLMESGIEARIWLLPGLVMVGMMRSRSALIGLMAGWGYISWANEWVVVHKKKITVGAIVLGCLFIGLGMGKSTLNSRDYFVQATAGLFKYPVGVGLGNFSKISQDITTHWWGRKDFSTIVHNLPLEWMVGMGWLGLVGWIWLGLVSWQLGSKTSGKRKLWRGVYWAILVNFLLDTTYFIPSMWWLWMVVMGLGEGED